MQSFFSSQSSKFNLLMVLCALGASTFSFPVKAAPQEVCVMTSAGDVVCGTLVQKPSSNQNGTDRNETLQTTVDDANAVTWELKSCVRQQKTVNCIFSLSSLSTSTDRGYNMSATPSKIVDAEGNEYFANLIQVGNKKASDWIQFNMAKGAKYRTTISFIGVPTSISQLTLISLHTSGNQKVVFRNVPIN